MNSRLRRSDWRFDFIGLALLLLIVCQFTMAQTSSQSSRRDINAVLAAHDQELLAMPDVVGVGVSTLEDHRTPCLRIMLARHNAKTERAIPPSIEGYPVVLEVTGEVRALHGQP